MDLETESEMNMAHKQERYIIISGYCSAWPKPNPKARGKVWAKA